MHETRREAMTWDAATSRATPPRPLLDRRVCSEPLSMMCATKEGIFTW